jgi:hypothetical protein
VDFPRRSELAALDDAEYEALCAFDDVIGDLEHECTAARAAADRLIALSGAAERRFDNGTAPLSLHCEALGEATAAAIAYTARLEQLAWRYASAYVVTGLEILDRLLAGRGALSKAELNAFAAEPTVGRLQELLETPAERRHAARSDSIVLEMRREEREQLLRLLEGVYFNQTSELRGVSRMTRQQVAAGRLSEMDDGEHDEPWTGLLDPVLALARQTPYDISLFLGRWPALRPPAEGEVMCMRRIHVCEETAVTVIDGYIADPGAEAGERLGLKVLVCARHDPAPAGWFTGMEVRANMDATPFTPTCGIALDYRDLEQALCAHADLWLTPLTGLDPADHEGWAAFLRAATTHVDATYDTDGDGDGQWNSVTVFLDQATRFAEEGDLFTALVGIGHAETATSAALAEATTATTGEPDGT